MVGSGLDLERGPVVVPRLRDVERALESPDTLSPNLVLDPKRQNDLNETP